VFGGTGGPYNIFTQKCRTQAVVFRAGSPESKGIITSIW